MIELLTPSKQTLMVLVLVCALFVIVRSMLRRNDDNSSRINLDDLVLEYDAATGRAHMSIIRVLALGAFALTCWIMIFLTLSGKITEGYFGLFNTAWVAPLTAYIIWGKKLPTPTAGPTTTVVADTVKVENP